MSEPKSILSHVSLGVLDVAASARFYDRVLGTMGIGRIMEEGGAIAYGREFPEFWIQRPFDEGEPGVANGTHIAFMGRSIDEVKSFFAEAVKAGATPDGEPGPRPHYGKPYYGCFVKDPDGHKIEAMYWDRSCGEGKA